jgi:PAS domain S-box-containing protein
MSILSGQGYVVYPASDGELALRFLNSNLPDLILLDIRMPGMDGIELCRQLKADKRTRDIPVIFISIIEKEHEKVKAFQAGGADYISKPFQPEEVLARVAHQLRLKRLTERLEKKILERTEELTKANRHLHAEIAVRKHAEDALRKSEALLNATQRLSKVGGWEFDVKTGKVFWTDELYNIHEMARDSTIDHIQESLFCYRDEDRQIIMEAFKNAYKNGKPYDLDFPFITRKGRHLWIRTTAMPIYEGSEIVSVIGNMMDITERKLMEESLRRSEQYQRTLLDNFPFFVWLKDKESRLLAANVQFARVAKVASTSELEGKTDFDFFPHDLASKYVADDRAVMETGRPKYDEEMYVDENGARHWMETWKSPLVVDGAMVGTVGYSRDITERREYAEQLREAHEFTEMVLNAIPDPVFVKDRDHKYKLVNNALCVLLGQPRNVLLGISDYDFLPAKQADVFWENDDLVFNSGEEMINDETITDAEGRVRIIQTKRALAGPDNLIGVIRDLTDMKQLKVAKEMAEKARQAAEDGLPGADHVESSSSEVV